MIDGTDLSIFIRMNPNDFNRSGINTLNVQATIPHMRNIVHNVDMVIRAKMAANHSSVSGWPPYLFLPVVNMLYPFGAKSHLFINITIIGNDMAP